jgi:hypothetical protein
MFSINPNDPTQLKMVGKPVNSGGEFPISIAIHPKSGNSKSLSSEEALY